VRRIYEAMSARAPGHPAVTALATFLNESTVTVEEDAKKPITHLKTSELRQGLLQAIRAGVFPTSQEPIVREELSGSTARGERKLASKGPSDL
jgi:hypothetical protein